MEIKVGTCLIAISDYGSNKTSIIKKGEICTVNRIFREVTTERISGLEIKTKKGLFSYIDIAWLSHPRYKKFDIYPLNSARMKKIEEIFM